MKTSAVAVLCLLSLFAWSPAGSGEKATSLSAARAAIDANLATAEGKAFDERVGKEFVDKHMAPLRQCKTTAGNDLRSFWILLKLDQNGAVQELLLYPETKLGTCARDAYLKDKFLPPPKPAYWVGIYLKLS